MKPRDLAIYLRKLQIRPYQDCKFAIAVQTWPETNWLADRVTVTVTAGEQWQNNLGNPDEVVITEHFETQEFAGANDESVFRLVDARVRKVVRAMEALIDELDCTKLRIEKPEAAKV